MLNEKISIRGIIEFAIMVIEFKFFMNNAFSVPSIFTFFNIYSFYFKMCKLL